MAVLALTHAVSAQVVLEPGDIIAGTTRPAVNADGETYDAGKLIVFGRNGVLRGDFVELPTPPGEPYSGSPTLNAKGEFVGLLFDGNYESIDSDFLFNPADTRSI